MRRARPNQVPVAPFNLRETGPLSTSEAFSRCGLKYYSANPAKEPGDSGRFTVDPTPCPHCPAIQLGVEWATTATTRPEHKTLTNPTGITRYVYARCRANPREHRWGFKDAPKAPQSPALRDPTPSPSQVANPPPAVPSKAPDMSALPPATNPIEAWINTLVGPRLDAAEESLKKLIAEGGGSVTLEQVRKLINELAPRRIEVASPLAVLKVNGVHHPVLDEMLERYLLGQRTFLLVGPAGTGKTTIALQFAKAINAARHSVISMSEQAREETLRGYRNAINDRYVASAIVEDLCESLTSATVTTLEEIDGSNPNTLLLLQPLENGFLSTPDADMPACPRGPDHVLIATANTYGHAGSNVYVGRNQLDAATLNRYATLFVDYDPKLEASIIADDEVYSMTVAIRTKADVAGIRKVFSTRDGVRLRFDQALTKNKRFELKRVATEYLKNSGWTTAEIGRVIQ